MRLLKARVKGFQSFGDSGEIEFAAGINLLVGQNNSGKSAFLRALLPVLEDDRHRTPDRWEFQKLPRPSLEMLLDLSGAELVDSIYRKGGNCHIPTPRPSVDHARHLLSCDAAKFRVSRRSKHELKIVDIDGAMVGSNSPAVEAKIGNDAELAFGSPVHSNTASFNSLLTEIWQQNMFYFSAERMTIGESGHGHAGRLASNASNLPNVLDTLKAGQGDLFSKLVAHLRDIFSTVGNLSVGPKIGSAAIEVRVWPTEAMPRIELSFPLNNSGTGVSQVIAILAAVMTAENAVVLIDEINSFLHPAAVKSLLRILQTEYGQHQYLISTHAPEVISFSNPSTLHLVRRNGYESTIEPVDLDQVEKFAEVGSHLGVSLADVFAADRIVWVEGPTEELCFPLLYRQGRGDSLPRGTLFTSVASTGQLSGRKHRQLVFDIYTRLTTSAAPLLTNVAFSFDSELLKETEKEDMRSQSGGKMHFLPRRHIECYLLDPDAIAAFIAAKDLQLPTTAVSGADVAAKVSALANETPFKNKAWKGSLQDVEWLKVVDAANIIDRACVEFTEARVTFSKKDDTRWLLQHIQAHNPESLSELVKYVLTLVEAVSA